MVLLDVRPVRALQNAVRRPSPRKLPIVVFVACMAVYLVWWAALYPGAMSYDSIAYVWHVTTGHWMANHSVLYDCLVWLSLRVSGDLAVLTLAQAAAASASMAMLASALRAFRVPGRWAAVAAVAVAALPSTGTFVVTVWKDVPFSLCAVAMTATLIRLLTRRRAADVVVLGVEILGLALFRNNGFLFVLITAALVIVLVAGVRLRVTIATAVPLAITYALSALVYPALGVEPVRPSLTYATAYSDIAVAYRARPKIFRAADLAVMAKVAPLDHWRSTATCYDSDPTMKKPFSWTAADQNYRQLVDLWVRTIGRAPDLVVDARFCRGSIAWVAFPGAAGERALIGRSDDVPADLFGWTTFNEEMRNSPYRPVLRTRPISRSLHDAAVFLRVATDSHSLEWLFWRGATWCYVAYAAVALLAWRRRRWALLAVAAPVAGQQFGVLVAIPAPLFRYMAAPIMIGVMLVPLALAALRRRV